MLKRRNVNFEPESPLTESNKQVCYNVLPVCRGVYHVPLFLVSWVYKDPLQLFSGMLVNINVQVI